MSFWYGSGSGAADPCPWLMNPDPDPAIFVIDLQAANIKLFFFLRITVLFEGTFTSFLKYKVLKKSQNSRIQGFSYYFCSMIEGSGSGSVSLTNGSGFGSRRPKNIRILRIRIRYTVPYRAFLPYRILRIRICVDKRAWAVDRFQASWVTTVLCRWLQLAQLAKGKKSRP